VHAEKRSTTTTPLQKLFMLNSPFVLTQAKALAARVAPIKGEKARIRKIYELLFARGPRTEEVDVALHFLRQPTKTEMNRWEQFAQALLVSNEMLYVD
jgi:hypothetical protein